MISKREASVNFEIKRRTSISIFGFPPKVFKNRRKEDPSLHLLSVNLSLPFPSSYVNKIEL
jgi:hypothetical protein